MPRTVQPTRAWLLNIGAADQSLFVRQDILVDIDKSSDICEQLEQRNFKRETAAPLVRRRMI